MGCTILEDNFIYALDELKKDSRIVIIDDKYYLKDMYDAECTIVKRFRILNDNENKIKKLDDNIKELEKFFNIKYNNTTINSNNTEHINQNNKSSNKDNEIKIVCC